MIYTRSQKKHYATSSARKSEKSTRTQRRSVQGKLVTGLKIISDVIHPSLDLENNAKPLDERLLEFNLFCCNCAHYIRQLWLKSVVEPIDALMHNDTYWIELLSAILRVEQLSAAHGFSVHGKLRGLKTRVEFEPRKWKDFTWLELATYNVPRLMEKLRSCTNKPASRSKSQGEVLVDIQSEYDKVIIPSSGEHKNGHDYF